MDDNLTQFVIGCEIDGHLSPTTVIETFRE